MKKLSDTTYLTTLVRGKELIFPSRFDKKIDEDRFYRQLFVINKSDSQYPHIEIASSDEFEWRKIAKPPRKEDCYSTEFYTGRKKMQRVYLLEQFCESCGIKKEAVISDMGKLFAVYDPTVFERLIKNGKRNFTSNAQRNAFLTSVWGQGAFGTERTLACYKAMDRILD